MCLIAFAIDPHAEYPLILVANRDEFFNRPTQTLHCWPGSISVYAGKDLQAGGTWLGINRNGRWAALTNFRQSDIKTGEHSRGHIVTRCLNTNENLNDYFEKLKADSHRYSRFNLIAGELHNGQTLYYSNQGQSIESLSPDFYALSNGLLHDEWPKMKTLKTGLKSLFQSNQLDSDSLLNLLNNAEKFERSLLPNTGIQKTIEHRLSSPFVTPFQLMGKMYGTRSSSVIVAHKSGRVNMLEKQHLPDNQSIERIEFQIKNCG